MKAKLSHKRLSPSAYFWIDYLSALSAWVALFIFRKHVFHTPIHIYNVLQDLNFIWGIIFIPIYWVLIYYFTGFYGDIYIKSRLIETIKTILVALFGCTILFFTLLLDDQVISYKNYYTSYFFLLSTHLSITLLGRLILLEYVKWQIKSKKVSYPTLLITESYQEGMILLQELKNTCEKLGLHIHKVLYIKDFPINKRHPRLQKIKQWMKIESTVSKENIEEIIVRLPENHLETVLNILSYKKVRIRKIPTTKDIVFGLNKTRDILDVILVDVLSEMTYWQKAIKRSLDIIISTSALLILAPLYVYLCIKVHMSSPGPIFYLQERIGLFGRPFKIFKFRSMYIDAEKNGPQLSSTYDNRITPFGKKMRQWRLDEIPQLFNVIRGDMSLVGHRPERRFFIEKISKKAPYYKRLMRIKPGISSWGMVQYGYAENVPEMIERLKYDILYLKNQSLYLDAKIMIYTLLTIMKGQGK